MIVRSITFLGIAIIVSLLAWRWERQLQVRRDRKALEVEHLLVTGMRSQIVWISWQAVGWCECTACVGNSLDGRPWGHVGHV